MTRTLLGLACLAVAFGLSLWASVHVLHSPWLAHLPDHWSAVAMATLGWAPLGLFLVLLGVLAMWRGDEPTVGTSATWARRLLTACGAGIAFPFVPARGLAFPNWHDDMLRGGPDFAEGATWMTYGLALVVVGVLVVAFLLSRQAAGRWLAGGRAYAAMLIPPPLVVLVILVVTR